MTNNRRIYIREVRSKYKVFGPPSFRGRHNLVKSLSWVALMIYKNGLTLRELHEVIDGSILRPEEFQHSISVNFNSLHALMNRWCHWGYLGHTDQKRDRRYIIVDRGRDWIVRWVEQGLIPIKQITAQIDAIEQHKRREMEALKIRLNKFREFYKKHGRYPTEDEIKNPEPRQGNTVD
jgi:hypothetical protein